MDLNLPNIATINLKVLLVRDDHLVCALPDEKTGNYTHKFIVPLPENVRPAPVVDTESDQQGIHVTGQSGNVQKRQRAAPGETKLAKCTAYYQQNPGKDKQDYIDHFVKEFMCTAQGANTYFHLCRKM